MVIATVILIYVALRTLCLLPHWFSICFQHPSFLEQQCVSILPLYTYHLVCLYFALWLPLWLKKLSLLNNQCVLLGVAMIYTVIATPVYPRETVCPSPLFSCHCDSTSVFFFDWKYDCNISLWSDIVNVIATSISPEAFKIGLSVNNTVFFPKHWLLL